MSPLTVAGGLWQTPANGRNQRTARGVLFVSTFIAFALSALCAEALPIIIPLPTVQITSLGHRYTSDPTTSNKAISDGVDFQCGSGEGTCSTSGFSAAIANGDEIVIRYEAPSGQRFHVFRRSALSSEGFEVFAEWVASGDRVSVFTHASVNFENLTGTAPTETYNEFGISDAGVAVFSEWQSNVTGDFTFTALTFTFTVNNSPPGATASFGPVQGLASPAFGAAGTGTPTTPDQVVMQLEPIPPPLSASVDLTSGTTGSIEMNQSFNGETRAADVTLLGNTNQAVLSMTLNGVSIRNSSVSVGARIYDDTTQAAIATANLLTPVGDHQTITIPISAPLAPGKSYRLALFVPSSANGNDGDLFIPAGGFGYVESQGVFRVNGGYDTPGDVFPATTNLSIPQISVEVALDTDGDGVPDQSDNCPYTANPDQKDSGGVGAGSLPDGIGDACQCGDVNNDGIVNGTDGTLLSRAAVNLAPFTAGVTALPGFAKCDVNASNTCDGTDATILRRATVGLAPAIKQGCTAAIPH